MDMVVDMAQFSKHWSSLLGDQVPDQKVVSSNPGDTGQLLGSHLKEIIYYTLPTTC